MQALAYWKAVIMDRANFLETLFRLLGESGIRYCVVGGQAVNAYAEPLVSLDLDLVVATEHLETLNSLLRKHFHVEVFPHSLNVSVTGSDLRVQFQTDPRYAAFLGRATTREVLGLVMPVAAVEDVLQGKVWATLDPERRPSKRRKDLLDIERLLEAHPHLDGLVPPGIKRRLAES